jgi:hypothetical protein
MQEIKHALKNLGKHFQTTRSTHQDVLRAKLRMNEDTVYVVPVRRSWLPVFSFGLAGTLLLVFVVKSSYEYRTVPIPEYDEYSYSDSFAEAADVAGVSIRSPQPQNSKSNTQEIIDYEQDNGDMLEETVTVSMLTKEDDVAATVSALFASLGGHLSSIRDNDEYATISGSIPAERLSFFYDQLDDLVENDDYIEKNIVGESIVAQAVDVADRLQALRDSEAEITKQLEAATTDEQKNMLQESLGTLSAEIEELTKELDMFKDRVEYVEVTVSVEQIPSLWQVEGSYELRQVIAGYETPNLWQRMVINVLTVFLVGLEVLSATFWVLIPLAVFGFVILRRRRLLRELA